MNRAYQDKPTAHATKTSAQIASQGITYNEPGLTYNAAGYMYGGFYGESDVVPITSYGRDTKPTGTASPTTSGVTMDSTTYNQAGYSYNQVGAVYGGFYGEPDTKPLHSQARVTRPVMQIGDSASDTFTTGLILDDAGDPILDENGDYILQ